MTDELPHPPRHVQAPALGVSPLEFWRGIYDHVFFSLNPLFRVPAPSDVSDDETVPVNGHSYFRPTEDPWQSHKNFDARIKSCGEVLRWQSLHQLIAPEVAFSTFALTLWLGTVLGRTSETDQTLADRIFKYCLDNAWYLPDENEMPPCQEPVIGKFFAALGVENVKAFDEFRWHSESVKVENFAAQNPPTSLTKSDQKDFIRCLHAEDPGVVMLWSFDDTSAVIGMTDRALAKANPMDFFEATSATSEMRGDWIRQLSSTAKFS